MHEKLVESRRVKIAVIVSAVLLLSFIVAFMYIVYGKRSRKLRADYDNMSETVSAQMKNEFYLRSEINRLKNMVSTAKTVEKSDDLPFARIEDYMRRNCVYSSESPEKQKELLKKHFGLTEKECYDIFSSYGNGRSGGFENLLTELRLEESAYLLKSGGDISIEEICRKLDFKSRQGYYRMFKNKYGVPPSDYRNC